MKIYDYAIKNIDEIAKEFNLNLTQGLDKKTVSEKIKTNGPNRLDLKKFSSWRIFFRQFKSAFVYLLIAAVIITMFLGEWIDTLMIFLFLAINAGLGFYQEYASEKTAQLLNNFALPRTKVLRQGKVEQITADQLVTGDIVLLQTGDKVPADIRLFKQDNITINETVLTGESLPVFKSVNALTVKLTTYVSAENILFSGTDVLKGEAQGVVIATGKQTAFGQIAKLATETKKVSDFEKSISRFSQFILKLVGITILVVFIAHFLINRDGINFFELVIFSVALTISVIPEALPLVTTFSLSRGARRLAKKNVIVKRLSAIEDLGGIEILCTDKTGTLTENELSLIDIFSEDKDKTIWLAYLASSFELEKKIEPFDIALGNSINSLQKNKIKKVNKIWEESFDPHARQNSVLVSEDDNKYLIIRGAPEVIFKSCSSLTADQKDNLNNWVKSHGRLGHRVLAVAYQEIKQEEITEEQINHEIKSDNFIFQGMVAFVDPIKKSSLQTVVQAKKLGIKIFILTGDSPEVAGAVAHQINLIDSPEQIITGQQWQSASPEQKENYLKKFNVFARVSPEDKFAIIEYLREEYMVGFLGEGINDAPALKIAGVSLVVNSAADIARESADVILLKKNLGVIIAGIQEGRQVFANTSKYIKSTLASNFGNFFAVATASLIVSFLPMLPIQILLVNLLSDTPMISISTDNVEASELKSPRKYNAKDIIIIAMILGLISTVFDFIFFGLFYKISPPVLQTNWFIGSILTELVLLFSIRTHSLFIKTLRPSTPIIWLSIITFVLTVGLPFTKFGQSIFHFVPPTPFHLTLILSLVVVYFVISEIVKLLYYRNKEISPS